MASRKQIEDTIQAVANAAAVNGFAQALEDFEKNLAKSILSLDGHEEIPERCKREVLQEIIGSVRYELDRRKSEATLSEAVSTAAVTALLSRPLPRLRLALAKFLGGAAQRLARP